MKRTPDLELDIPRSMDIVLHPRLKCHEQILILRCDVTIQIEGALRLIKLAIFIHPVKIEHSPNRGMPSDE